MTRETSPLTLIPVGRTVAPATTYDAPADLPAAGAGGSRLLLDRYGRVARDLRVSLTDRCNLRCTYCMPAEGLDWLPTDATLDDGEMVRLITIAVEKLGIRQIRFTGGEPLLRKSLEKIITATKALTTDEGGKVMTAMTTNGMGLARRAQKLADAGLDRVNISLDTIDAELYARLTRRDRLQDAIDAIDAAIEAGLTPVKVNAVVMPGVNEHAITDLARFTLRRGAQLRFIEQMPLGPPEKWERSQMITAQDILDELATEFDMSPAAEPRGSAPAALWEVADRAEPGLSGRIGVIASVSHPFCGNCDRSRLTTDGAVRSCLFSSADSETSLRDLMRAGATDEEIAEAWAGTMWLKKPGHGIDDEGFLQPDRPMSAIGG